MAIEHLTQRNTAGLRQIADHIAAAKKIVVVTGAGISTSSGIPDFRSQDGLYSLIRSEYQTESSTKQVEPASVKGKDLFDSSLWRSELSTSVFYKFIASMRRKIREDNVRPTPTHRFLATLRDRRKLVRTYTQNIDGLEAAVGLSTDMTQGRGSRRRFMKKSVELPTDAPRIAGTDLNGGCEAVQLHGELNTLRCTLCMDVCDWGKSDECEETFLAGKAPLCETCVEKDEIRKIRGCRGLAVGSLRPNIVLYGEEHPSADLIAPVVKGDIAIAPDLLLIFGTSLKVHGLKNIVRQFANAVHSIKNGKGKVIFINATEPASSTWKDYIDYWVESDCDSFVSAMKKHRPDIFHQQSVISAPAVKKVPVAKPKTGTKRKFMDEEVDKENDADAAEFNPLMTPKATLKRRRIQKLPNTPKTPSRTFTNTPSKRSVSQSTKSAPKRSPLQDLSSDSSSSPANAYPTPSTRRVGRPRKEEADSITIWSDNNERPRKTARVEIQSSSQEPHN